MTLDHVWPRSRGGRRPQNILGAHMACNNAKGDRVPTVAEMAYLRRINVRLQAPEEEQHQDDDQHQPQTAAEAIARPPASSAAVPVAAASEEDEQHNNDEQKRHDG